MPFPLVKSKIVKKRTKKFKRHQSDTAIRVSESWRRPKGIDSRVRRKWRGKVLMPNIGYGSNKKTRHLLPNGFYKMLISNVDELDVLMMHNRTYCVEIAHSVSSRKRIAILDRAAQFDLKVTNAGAKVKVEETQ
uniref:Ribosome protein L32 n=1 Tax=Griffithsia japonica TaxID=83288 RepID=Q7XY96_GRIJA|nr:ribosome protein L32 [Griffithsia japonica]